jgi:hypothetical protein
MGKTKTYDMNGIFAIKVLKSLELIKNYTEGARVYYELTGEEISPSVLSRKIKNFQFIVSDKVEDDTNEQTNPYLSIHPYEVFIKYLDRCQSALRRAVPDRYTIEETEQLEREKNIKFSGPKDQLLHTFSITEDDLILKFGVDLKKDDSTIISKKIRSKMADEVFFLDYLGFDPSIFEIKKYDWGFWDVTINKKLYNGASIADKITNYKFNVVIGKRKQPIFAISEEKIRMILGDVLREKLLSPDDLFGKGISPDAPTVSKSPIITFSKISERNPDRLIVCPGMELHLGKLGSVSEYEDYSTKQAMWRFIRICEEVIRYQWWQNAEKLLLGIGNDFFNSDTPDDKTTAGTPQDNDTRFKEVFLWGQVGFIRFIEVAKEYYDKIILKGNPGNHDEVSSFNLYTFLYSLYTMTQDKKVEVGLTYEDIRFMTSYVFGDNLIVLAHGKTPEGKAFNNRKLVDLINTQFSDQVRQTKRTLAFVGHQHKESYNIYGDTHIIRTPAPTGIDSFHSSNGYVLARQGHPLYTIDKKAGISNINYITFAGEESDVEKIGSMSRDPKANVYDEMTKALNLTGDTVRQRLKGEELSVIDTIIDRINVDWDERLEKLCGIMKVNKTKLKSQQLRAIREIFGSHNEQIQELEIRKSLIKEYKYNPNGLPK